MITMLTIMNTLNGQDLGFLKMIANLWGIELTAADAYTARQQLANAMNNPSLIEEIYEACPQTAREALDNLLDQEGTLPWSKFTRKFGQVRVMGSAKRDRERPDLKPQTPSEYLWYRGFLSRAFLKGEGDPQEYAFIPQEIFDVLQPAHLQKIQLPGRQATNKESQFIFKEETPIAEDICTVAAGVRNGFDESLIGQFCQVPADFLLQLMGEMKIISNQAIETDHLREYLESTAEEAIYKAYRVWLESMNINEMCWVTSLEIEREPDRNHKHARQFILDQISRLPEDKWWHIDSFINAIYQTNPDFQRPAGNYDTWYVKNPVDGTYYRGFKTWEAVDGATLRFMISGPLQWMGLVQLAGTKEDSPSAFKPSPRFHQFLIHQIPEMKEAQEGKVILNSYGKITIPEHFPLASRYQIARFGDWLPDTKKGYSYQLSAKSLARAKEQGLKVNHLLKVLQPFLNHPFPPRLKTALEHWESFGTQAYFSEMTLLQISDSEIIARLMASPAKKFVLNQLNPSILAVKSKGLDQIRKALLELGYFSETLNE